MISNLYITQSRFWEVRTVEDTNTQIVFDSLFCEGNNYDKC